MRVYYIQEPRARKLLEYDRRSQHHYEGLSTLERKAAQSGPTVLV